MMNEFNLGLKIVKIKKISRTLKLSIALAFLYASLGWYVLYFDGGMIRESLNSDYISAGVRGFFDFYIIFPSHIFGSFTWFVLSGAKEDGPKILILLGQIIGFVIYTQLFYLIIIITQSFFRKSKRIVDKEMGI